MFRALFDLESDPDPHPNKNQKSTETVFSCPKHGMITNILTELLKGAGEIRLRWKNLNEVWSDDEMEL